MHHTSILALPVEHSQAAFTAYNERFHEKRTASLDFHTGFMHFMRVVHRVLPLLRILHRARPVRWSFISRFSIGWHAYMLAAYINVYILMIGERRKHDRMQGGRGKRWRGWGEEEHWLYIANIGCFGGWIQCSCSGWLRR